MQRQHLTDFKDIFAYYRGVGVRAVFNMTGIVVSVAVRVQAGPLSTAHTYEEAIFMAASRAVLPRRGKALVEMCLLCVC